MKTTLIEKLFAMTYWIFWIAKLTALMWIGCILGGVLFGIGPTIIVATRVVLDLTKHKQIDFKSYATMYKRSFKVGNQIYIPLCVLIMIALLWENAFLLSGFSIIYKVIFLYLLQFILVLPTMKFSYELSWKQAVKDLWRFSWYNPVNTCLLLLLNAALINFYYLLPGVIPFFSLGLAMFLNVVLMKNFIEYNEKRIKEEKQLGKLDTYATEN